MPAKGSGGVKKWVRMSGSVAIAVGVLIPLAASADPPCGKGWRKHEACGPVYVAPAPVIVVPPAVQYYPPQPVYVAPQPVYIQPPPSVYAPAPVVLGPPSLQLGLTVPLR